MIGPVEQLAKHRPRGGKTGIRKLPVRIAAGPRCLPLERTELWLTMVPEPAPPSFVGLGRWEPAPGGALAPFFFAAVWIALLAGRGRSLAQILAVLPATAISPRAAGT